MTTAARSKAAAAMGRARTPAKIAAARLNAAKATAARMALTPAQRREQAQKAALSRWGKKSALMPPAASAR
jgi:hypothetical protein